MRKLTLLLVVLSFMTVAVTAQKPTGIVKIDDADWTPFLMQTEPYGFAHDMLVAYFKERGIQYKFDLVPPLRADAFMKDGTLDLMIYSFKKEREEWAIYGKEPMFTVEYRIIVRADFDKSPKTLEDLDGYSLGRIRGIAYTPEITAFLDKMAAKNKVTVVDNAEKMLKMLVAKNIDAFLDSSATAGWEIDALNMDEKVKFSGTGMSTKPYFLAVSKTSKVIPDHAAFIADFDAWLKAFKAKPAFKTLQKKYGLRY